MATAGNEWIKIQLVQQEADKFNSKHGVSHSIDSSQMGLFVYFHRSSTCSQLAAVLISGQVPTGKIQKAQWGYSPIHLECVDR